MTHRKRDEKGPINLQHNNQLIFLQLMIIKRSLCLRGIILQACPLLTNIVMMLKS